MGITMRRATTGLGGVALAVTATTVTAHGAEPVHIDADEVFVEGGSVGTWAITGGDGGFERLAGSGTLVGTPSDTGINDVYDGTLRP